MIPPPHTHVILPDNTDGLRSSRSLQCCERATECSTNGKQKSRGAEGERNAKEQGAWERVRMDSVTQDST